MILIKLCPNSEKCFGSLFAVARNTSTLNFFFVAKQSSSPHPRKGCGKRVSDCGRRFSIGKQKESKFDGNIELHRFIPIELEQPLITLNSALQIEAEEP